MKSASYMTRALQARDPRFARILARLGYPVPDDRAAELAAQGARERKPESKAKVASPARKRRKARKSK